MIPRDFVTEWRAHAPWVQDFHVEQDLVISRALVAIFADPLLATCLAFRGGTAIHKLHLRPAARYSSGAFEHVVERFDRAVTADRKRRHEMSREGQIPLKKRKQ